MIAIDTETYFHKTKCSVRHLGAEAYTRHPEFYCYMVSIWGEGIQYVGPPEKAPWDKIAGKLWVAHNAQFDMWVIKRMRDSGQIPDVHPSNWRDTSAIPAYMQVGRSLGNAAKYLLGETPDKAIRDGMSGKHYKDLPQDEKQLMLDYALSDARLCHDLYDKFSDQLPEDEWRLSEITVEQGNHGVQINRRLLEEQLAEVRVNELLYMEQIPWRNDKAPLSVAALRTQCREDRIPDMPKTTQADNPEWLEWFGKYEGDYPYIKAFTQLRRLRKHLATLETLLKRMDSDEVYHFGLKYCGSRLTGRWSGDGGLNMQNLPKGELFGATIRHLFTARPGHKLLVADLSQIEPRVLAYVSGDWEFLDHVRNGVDCYESHARTTMGYKDPRPLKDVDNDMRQLAKARCLAGTTPILTDKGYFTIAELQNKTGLRVWDGVAWVQYERIQQTGTMSVINLNGEHYTDDHRIFVSETETRSAREISQRPHLAADRNTPGGNWADVWRLARFVVRTLAKEWWSPCQSRVYSLWRSFHSGTP